MTAAFGVALNQVREMNERGFPPALLNVWNGTVFGATECN